MIILGDRHSFTDSETASLQKHFSQITQISYRDSDPDKIIPQIERHIDTKKPEVILLNTLTPIHPELLRYLIRLENSSIRYLTLDQFMERYLHKCFIDQNLTDASFLANIRPYSTWQLIQKKCIDLAIAIPLALLTSPVMLYVAYRIKQESPNGSVFFTQIRVGKNGREFSCHKFRSMHTDTDYFNKYTQEDDPRIFPWGALMRKSRIDELPQLWNVLKGDLHIIGPRAEWNELVEEYESQIPYYHERHLNAPGITGWAQVNYPYGANIEDTVQKLMYDLYYIKHWSLWLEIKTIWKTVSVMLGGEGR